MVCDLGSESGEGMHIVRHNKMLPEKSKRSCCFYVLKDETFNGYYGFPLACKLMTDEKNKINL